MPPDWRNQPAPGAFSMSFVMIFAFYQGVTAKAAAYQIKYSMVFSAVSRVFWFPSSTASRSSTGPRAYRESEVVLNMSIGTMRL